MAATLAPPIECGRNLGVSLVIQLISFFCFEDNRTKCGRTAYISHVDSSAQLVGFAHP